MCSTEERIDRKLLVHLRSAHGKETTNQYPRIQKSSKLNHKPLTSPINRMRLQDFQFKQYSVTKKSDKQANPLSNVQMPQESKSYHIRKTITLRSVCPGQNVIREKVRTLTLHGQTG